MGKINLSDLLEPEHMDPVKRIALIRIVDDDGGVRESYKFLIESEGWRVKTYPSAEAFLEEDDPTVPGCGVFDVRMTGITGMELHQKPRGCFRASLSGSPRGSASCSRAAASLGTWR